MREKKRFPTKFVFLSRLMIGMALLILGVPLLLLLSIGFTAEAASIDNRYIRLSKSEPAATGVNYQINFDLATNQSLGSVVIEICSNSPIYYVACNAPNGFSWAGSSIASQSGLTDFSINPSTTVNRLVLSRPNSLVNAPQNINITMSGVVNPANAGSFYGRIFTLPANDGTGPFTDFGGIALAVNNSIPLATEVPPFLYFCSGLTISGFDCETATGSYIDFGELSKTAPSTATSQMVIGTNADYGYAVSINGKSPTSGNNVIPGNATNVPSSPGSSQFGINLRANSNPSLGNDVTGAGIAQPSSGYDIPNRFKFVDGDNIIYSPDVSLQNKFTVSYLINVSPTQKAGLYSTTLIYVATATF